MRNPIGMTTQSDDGQHREVVEKASCGGSSDMEVTTLLLVTVEIIRLLLVGAVA